MEGMQFYSYGIDGGLSRFYWFVRGLDGSWDTVGVDPDEFYWGGENGCDTREEAIEESKRFKEKYPNASIMVSENINLGERHGDH